MAAIFHRLSAGGLTPPTLALLRLALVTPVNSPWLKGIFGEKVSDDFMTGRGYKSELSADRQMRLLEQQPTGRGIDGVYRKPPKSDPPPYVVTETKFRADGKVKGLPTTKGSKGYPSAKQMSTRWITDRLPDAVGQVQARNILKEKYESWLMVVDETGAVVDITKLDKAGNALLDDAGKPIKVSVQPETIN
ncbi:MULTISPECIES: hypothetical protein [unclassified Caballeronia]|uniref:hypothetical protein n=1 Tax=unclassified Caballeronia TaxID=2646786 RepID=UPI00285B080B|nr:MULTISPECIES: hypothetical protein [unclassified Caballeronia]MDR5754495.1 hypothetical protein [Caballeronia sp. LZ024]MDR5840873.1 hypothetical protein [Caballeronia sp. LZ031]